jgi:hypothetical protein
MGRDQGGAESALASRYECKYLVSPEVASEIRAFVAPFMVPDRFAREHATRGYPLCSLYFDSPDLHLYRQTAAGEKNRFKLRVRSYADETDAPVFLEVKRRINDVILKRRAKLCRDAAVAVLTTGHFDGLGESTRELLADLEFFRGHLTLAAARPFLRIRYLREAYEGVGGDPLRITLDTDIAWSPTSIVDFRLGGDGWIQTPVPGTVLEIKFTDRYPAWVGEMIRVFALQRQSVAKYVLSVDSFFAQPSLTNVEMQRSSAAAAALDRHAAWALEV